MKFKNIFILFIVALLTSCQGVDSGHKGVYVDWGGKTDMSKVYDEGMAFAAALWFGADLIEYDVREQAMTISGEYLDYDGLDTELKVTMYYQPMPLSVNKLHTGVGPDYRESKMGPLFQAAVRTEAAKHQALELNRTKRPEAESSLLAGLKEDMSTLFVNVTRVQILDVDLPDKISQQIIAAKVQDEKNNLSEKMKLEKENIGKALLAESDYALQTAQNTAKTKAILSQPAMLKLKEIEIQDKMWDGFLKHGNSPFGENNVFGSGTSVIKGLK